MGLLVQLKPGIKTVLFREQMGIPMAAMETIDEGFRLFHIRTRDTAEETLFFNRLRHSPNCVAVQHVHPVKNRSSSPDDPYLSQQIYLQRSSVPAVWPYLHGGISRVGDTLVLAIIDSGMDTLHPDLVANAWINRGEIPWNNQDDDSNGYVDDVRGWNGGDNNPRTYTTVTLDNHGTAIAGIAGAEGNNSKGIAGINWNIRLMPVVCYPEQGAGSDIGVIRSMIYVFRMKQLYLNSAGLKGANIVALNTSIGIDLAMPDDAPVWCAMYDSLGSVGVLSAGATTNNNIDVGTKGDIPSTCPSKYLVVTTSTDQNDNFASRGYSSTFVDLAAMGEGVFTTTLLRNAGSFGPYNSFTGTSFAAPQVAATTALIYQHACDTFLYLAKNNPDSAMRLLSGWIKAGTDKLNTLSGKCTSGGRLNAFKTWQLMDQWCLQHDIPYSLREIMEISAIAVPNPVRSGDPVSIKMPRIPAHGRLELWTVNGKMVRTEPFVGSDSIEVSTQNLAPGVYFIAIITDSGCVKTRLQIL